MPVAPLVIADLTQAILPGTGAFDVLMRANKEHLDAEFQKGRIKGSEYATVYLGSLQSVLQTSLAYVFQQYKAQAEVALIEAQTALVAQQTLNAAMEHNVLFAQKCKLEAEFDLTVSTTLKSAQELSLLAQKIATEKAQTTGLGVDADSVVGRQKALYQAQTTGFQRDAEQKAADLLVRSWSVQRTTDETGTTANATNMLNDATVGRVMTKLLAGVGA